MARSRSARTEALPAWDAVDGSAGATTRGRKRQRTSNTSPVTVPLQQQSICRPDDPSWFTSMLEDFRNTNYSTVVNADLPNMGASLNTNDPADLEGSTLHVIECALAGKKIVTSSVQSEKTPTSIVGNSQGHFLLNDNARVIMDLDELSKEQLVELLGSLQIDFDDLQKADVMNTLVTGVILKGIFFTNSAGKIPKILCHELHSFQLDPTPAIAFCRLLTSCRIHANAAHPLQTRPRRPFQPRRRPAQPVQPRRPPQ